MNPQGQAVATGGLPNDIVGLAGYGLLWYEILGLIAVCLLGVALVWWIVRRVNGRQPAIKEERKPEDLFGDLLRDLSGLAPEKPFTRERQVEFYYRLSMCLRRGIELRTGVPATDLTYKEIKERVGADLPMGSETSRQVLDFLRRADLIKFAKQEADAETAFNERETVGSWVNELKPRPVVDQEVVK